MEEANTNTPEQTPAADTTAPQSEPQSTELSDMQKLDLELEKITQGADLPPVQVEDRIEERPEEVMEPSQAEQQAQQLQEPVKKPSEKFAELTQKDKARRQREQEVQQLQEQNQYLQQQMQQTQQFIQQLQQNPIAVLRRAGYTDDQLISLLAQTDSMPAVTEQAYTQQPTQESQQIQQLQQQIQQMQEQRQQESVKNAEAQFVSALQEEVNHNPDSFEMVVQYSADPSENNSIELIKEAAQAYYNTYNELPSLADVMTQVEDYLTEIQEKKLKALQGTKKFSSLFNVQQQPTQTTNTPATHNELTQQQPTNQPSPKPTSELTEEELMQIAIGELEKLERDGNG